MRVSVRIPDELGVVLTKFAELEGRSLSGYILWVLGRHAAMVVAVVRHQEAMVAAGAEAAEGEGTAGGPRSSLSTSTTNATRLGVTKPALRVSARRVPRAPVSRQFSRLAGRAMTGFNEGCGCPGKMAGKHLKLCPSGLSPASEGGQQS